MGSLSPGSHVHAFGGGVPPGRHPTESFPVLSASSTRSARCPDGAAIALRVVTRPEHLRHRPVAVRVPSASSGPTSGPDSGRIEGSFT